MIIRQYILNGSELSREQLRNVLNTRRFSIPRLLNFSIQDGERFWYACCDC